LKIGLGDALANAGRPAEAAREFLETATTTSARRALEITTTSGCAIIDGWTHRRRLEVFRSS